MTVNNPVDSLLKRTLEAGKFAVTAEMAPPKGTDFAKTLASAQCLVGRVHGVNCTDGQSAVVRATSLGLALELMHMGLEPVMQMTGRDRNRIAVQGELMTASHFGIANLLCITGDHPVIGDHPEAMPVYEMNAVALLKTVKALNAGKDLAGNDLLGSTAIFAGAAVSPAYEPLDLQVLQMRKKVRAGARFFQSQAVFDINVLRTFREKTKDLSVPLLVGIIPLKGAGMARFMNRCIPGIQVPDAVIDRMAQAEHPAEEGIAIASEFIAAIKAEGLCEGVNIMTIDATHKVPVILDRAGI